MKRIANVEMVVVIMFEVIIGEFKSESIELEITQLVLNPIFLLLIHPNTTSTQYYCSLVSICAFKLYEIITWSLPVMPDPQARGSVLSELTKPSSHATAALVC